LVDTGAVTSCISEQFARFLHLRPQPTTDNVKLISANKSPIRSLGTVDAELSIQGLVVPFTFHVLRSLSHKLLLGQDFLRFSNAVIDCGERVITLFDGLVCAALTRFSDRDSVLRLAQDLIIPPATEVLVKLMVPQRHRRKVGLMETFSPLKNKFLVVANAIVKPKDNYTVGRILNIGLTTRRLRARTPIAYLYPIDLNDPFNKAMLSMDTEQHEAQETSPRRTHMPEHADRITILKALGLKLDNPNLSEEQFSQLTALLYEYQEIFCADYENLPISKLPPYQIKLTNDTPIRQKQYPLSPQHEKVMEKYVDKLLKAKIVEPSVSPWNSPAILIRKAHFDPAKADQVDQYRLCVDMRRLNQVIRHEFQSLISLEQTCHMVASQQSQTQGQPNEMTFTSFDLTASFYQQPLEESCRPFTAFSTRTQHVQFCKSPMGLSNSPAAFCASLFQLMRKELMTNLSIYVDDALLISNDFISHLRLLRDIFEKFRKNDLRINPQKSAFARDSVVFLGFLFTRDGVKVDPKRFDKIRNLKPATNQKEVRHLIGFFLYFRKHLPGFSKIITPLRELLLKDAKFHWGEAQNNALEKLKHLLLQNATLIFPDLNAPFLIMVDASKHAAAHCLLQKKDGVLKPVAFGGRTFKKYEQNLSACDSELIALVHAIQTYHHFLSNGRPFTILTDHCSLTYLRNLKFSTSPKLVRYALILQNFQFDVVYIRGKNNVIADFLSRYPMHDDEAADEEHKTHADPLEDIDHYNYLGALDVDAYIADSDITFRDPAKKRRRNYSVYQLVPLSDASQSESVEAHENTGNRRKSKSQKRRRLQPENIPADVESEQTTEVDADTQLLDEATSTEQANLYSQLSPQINLESQKDDPFFEAVITYLQDGALPNDKTMAQRVLYQADDFFIQDDQLWHLARLKSKRLQQIAPRFHQLCIPKSFRMKIMQAIHEVSHYSFLKCYLTARQRFYWHSMATEFAMFTQSCLVCQQIRNSAKPNYPLTSIPPSNLFDTLMIDYHEIRPPKNTNHEGFKYVLILLEQMSQYVTLVPTKDMRAETAAQAIMDHYILRFGAFRYLVSDRSSSWLNQLFEAFLKMPGMQAHHVRTSPFRPQTNSLTELQNRSIVRHLRAFCTDSSTFHQFLPAISAAINGTTNITLGVSPFFVLHGVNYRFPFETALTSNEQPFREWDRPGLQPLAQRLEIVRDIVMQNIKDTRANTDRLKNVNAKPHDFQVGDRVFIPSEFDSSRLSNKKHQAAWIGPYVVVSIRNSLVKLVHFYTGRELKNYINVDKLKRLRDSSRDILYNRHRTDPHSYTSDAPPTEQPTIQIRRTTEKEAPQPLTVIKRATVLDDSDVTVDAHGRITDAMNLYDPSERHPNCIGDVHAADGSKIEVSQSRETGTRHAQKPSPSRSLLLPVHRTQSHLDDSTAHITGLDDDDTEPFHLHKERPPVFFGDVRFQAEPRCNNKQDEDYMSVTPSTVCENESHTRETERQEIIPAVEYKITRPERRQFITANPRESFSVVPVTTAVTVPLNLQPTTNEKPAISPSRDSRAQTRLSETSADTLLDSMNTERRVNTEPNPANTEEETNNLQATDVTDSVTNHMSAQLTDGMSDLTELSRGSHDIKTGETSQQQTSVKQNETPTIRSFKSWDLGSNGSRCDTNIVKVIARKAAKPQALYKAKFKGESAPRWVPVMQIPPEILAEFHVRRFQRKKKRKI
jgi:hypothetical protein